MLGDMSEASDSLGRSLATLDTEEGRKLFAFGGSPFSFACTFRAWALAELGQFAEAEAVGRAGFENARALDQPYTIMCSTFGYSHVHLRRGDWEKAAEITDIGREQFGLHGIVVGGHWIFARRAVAAARQGDAALAEELIALATETVSRSGNDSFYETLLADAELQLSHAVRAADRARTAIAAASAQGEKVTVGWGNLILAEALSRMREGDSAEARAALHRAASLAHELGLVPLADRAKALDRRRTARNSHDSTA